MKPILFHPQAAEELEEAVSFYEGYNAGLGRELRIEVERGTHQIQRFTSIGARYKDTDCRQFVLKRFPYLLFYLEQPDAIWIVAVAHGKRKPGYWREREIGEGSLQ